jgi:hypothetical protein
MDDIEYLRSVMAGTIKPKCVLCGCDAVSMRRESIPDGSELGIDFKTGLTCRYERFKPGAMIWFCRQHAPTKGVPSASTVQS